MIPDCIYEVHTHWGWFRLDEGAYADYLAGKLWITWVPGKPPQRTFDTPTAPANVTDKAIRLRDLAARSSAYDVCCRFFSGKTVEVPYRQSMSDIPISEMCLSVRASNGLMRARAETFGKVKAIMETGNGLLGIRNLGVKSEQEIRLHFFNGCYQQLNEYEKAAWWQKTIGTDQSSFAQEKTEHTLTPSSAV